MDAVLAYKLFASDTTTSLERIKEKPLVERNVEYYKENITSIKTADDLIDNNQIFGLITSAYGMEDMSYAKGFFKRLLKEGTDDPGSMANTLSDARYLEFAEDFNFLRTGEATTAFDKVTVGVIDKYYQQSLEVEAGEQNDGVRLAMYFERKAEEITSGYSILADAALLKFVQTTFNLPSQMSYQDLDTQVEMMAEKFDIADLSDPDKVKDLVDRFLVNWDFQNPDTVAISPLISQPSSLVNFSVDLLSSIQNIRSK
ncbi:MAG: DUF1217 domain-containing protein [Nitratireductor sp.]